MNPYNNFQAANSKEYISLNKGAKQDFHPETCYDIIPGNSDVFSAEIKKYDAQLDMDPCSTFRLTAMLMLWMQTQLPTKTTSI